jgi:hypothetical protein
VTADDLVGVPEPEPEPTEVEAAAAAYPLPEDRGTGGGPAAANQILWDLIHRTPYWSLYLKTLDRDPFDRRARVAYMAEFILLTVVLLILLAIAIGIAWKALAPLPHDFFQGGGTTATSVPSKH